MISLKLIIRHSSKWRVLLDDLTEEFSIEFDDSEDIDTMMDSYNLVIPIYKR